MTVLARILHELPELSVDFTSAAWLILCRSIAIAMVQAGSAGMCREIRRQRQRHSVYFFPNPNFASMSLKISINKVNPSETHAICGLSCRHLDVRIGGIDVAADLSLELAPGEFWGLLGPNGIGKTTLLKCLAGLSSPASGQVFLESRDINELPR